MKTIKIKLYKYNELNDKAKEKAIEDYYQVIDCEPMDFDWVELDTYLPDRILALMDDKHNCIRGLKGEKAITYLFSFKNIYWDFNNGYISFKDFDYSSLELLYKFLKIPKKYWGNMGVSWDDRGRNRIELVIDWDDHEQEKPEKYIERAEQIFNDFIEKVYRSIKADYDYRCSQEGIIEEIRANQYDFTKEGERW